MALSKRDRDEFIAYLRACTDNQVKGVHEKESKADRQDYAALAEAEAHRRGIDLFGLG